MDEMIEMNYDEHVKAHQRHVLISWLESAKSEKIKAVKDSVKIRSIKVIAPTLDINMIAQPIISDELLQTINHRFDGIPTDVEVPSAVVVAEQTEEETQAIKQRFDGIPTGVDVPSAVVVAEQTEEEAQAIKQRFDDIPTGVDVPSAVVVAEQTEEEARAIKQRFDGIPTGVEVPSAVVVAEQTEEEAQDIKQKFDGIRTNAAVPEKITVDPEAISVQLPSISLPPKPQLDISDIIERLIAEKSRIGRTESQ